MVALLLILISLLVIPAAPAVADAPQATTTEVTAYGVGAGVDLDQFRAALKHIKALHKIPSAQLQSTTRNGLTQTAFRSIPLRQWTEIGGATAKGKPALIVIKRTHIVRDAKSLAAAQARIRALEAALATAQTQLKQQRAEQQAHSAAQERVLHKVLDRAKQSAQRARAAARQLRRLNIEHHHLLSLFATQAAQLEQAQQVAQASGVSRGVGQVHKGGDRRHARSAAKPQDQSRSTDWWSLWVLFLELCLSLSLHVSPVLAAALAIFSPLLLLLTCLGWSVCNQQAEAEKTYLPPPPCVGCCDAINKAWCAQLPRPPEVLPPTPAIKGDQGATAPAHESDTCTRKSWKPYAEKTLCECLPRGASFPGHVGKDGRIGQVSSSRETHLVRGRQAISASRTPLA